ncbi:MAG: copper ion binding protein, partial [Thermodesulfobacteriota bacterium]|nr:copper ion binding protein [Thermodesulfobacteriota bacterium]
MNDQKSKTTTSYTLAVDGMSCEHCEAMVDQTVRSVAGVTDARVDLEGASVEVFGGKPHVVIEAIKKAGYEARPSAIISETCELQVGEVADAGTAEQKTGGQSYIIRVTDMACAACVANVEKAILAVPGVTEAAVNLVEKSGLVSGGDPEAVIASIISHGYNAGLDESSMAINLDSDDGYEIAISNMTCSSCVRNVELAILEVEGVSSATVNLVEKKARVVGGDPQQVVNAVIDHGYDGSLIEIRSSGTFLLVVEDQKTELETIRQLLLGSDPAGELVLDNDRLQVTTSLHPADVLLLLQDAGIQAGIEELYIDPYLEQAEETRKEIRRSWQRAIVAALAGFGIMAGDMSGLFPPLADNQLFWFMLALVCLGVMYFSGRNYYITAWKQARHRSSNMDTLVALGTSAAWLASLLIIIKPDFIPGRESHLYLDASVMILAFLQFGHALETRAKRTTSEAISSLVGLRARSAMLVRGDQELEIPVSLLHLDDSIRVKPGEKIPIDGEIVD